MVIEKSILVKKIGDGVEIQMTKSMLNQSKDVFENNGGFRPVAKIVYAHLEKAKSLSPNVYLVSMHKPTYQFFARQMDLQKR